MSKHTPGPWSIEPYGPYDKSIIILEPRAMVDNDDVDPKEATANARLIAAAPDLLAALSDLADIVGGEILSENDPRMKQARTIIAKATAVIPTDREDSK